MLINIRKNAIYFSFTIFAAAATVITVMIPDNLPYKDSFPFRDSIDLSIALILIAFPFVFVFYYLEKHYRYYLLKIVDTASEYEETLELGVLLSKKCEYHNKHTPCNMVASISKCLKCLHDYGMEAHIKSANFNIYAFLLAIGFIALNFLIAIKIGVSRQENLQFTIVTALFTIFLLIRYATRPPKNQAGNNDIDNNSWVYRIPLIVFMGLTYLIFYFIFNLDINKSFPVINISISSFMLSYLVAVTVSGILFKFMKKLIRIIICSKKIMDL